MYSLQYSCRNRLRLIKPGPRLFYYIIHNSLQVVGLLKNTKLSVGAGARLQNLVDVTDLLPAAKLVDNIINELEQLLNQAKLKLPGARQRQRQL